jgi:ribonuclease HI
MEYYAVRHGKERSVVHSMRCLRKITTSLSRVQYRRFQSRDEADIWLADPPSPRLPVKISQRLKSKTLHSPVLAYPSRPNELIVFCDGSVRSKTGGVGVWFGENDARNLSRTMDALLFPNPTSLTAELYAVQCAIEKAIDSHTGPVGIVSDSGNVIQIMNEKRFNVKGKLARHRELIVTICTLVDAHGGLARIAFYKVKGHSGVRGNVMADKLAGDASKQ